MPAQHLGDGHGAVVEDGLEVFQGGLQVCLALLARGDVFFDGDVVGQLADAVLHR